MIDHKLGPRDRTVSIFIDRAYPVVKTVYVHLDKIFAVYDKLDSIQYIVDNWDDIQNIQDAADSLQTITEHLDELLSIGDKFTEFLTILDEKEEELLKISGTYYIPYVDEDGNLSWTNTGDLENPPTVNIKGVQGDPGYNFNPDYRGLTEEKSLYDDYPKGTSFLDIETGFIYFKLSDDSGDWSEGFSFSGSSVNSILMDPDPVAYFDEIYGMSSGDIIGSLVVSQSPIEPDPTETFESTLNT